MKRSRKFTLGCLGGLGLVGLLVLIANFVFLDFVVDAMWYESQGYLNLMLLKIGYKYVVLAGATFVLFLLMFLNFWVASRYLGETLVHKEDRVRRVVKGFRSGSLKVYTPVCLILALLLAFPLFRQWEDVLLYVCAPTTGNADALFGLDVSFYLFGLPVLLMVQGRLFWTLILLLVSLGVLYAAELRMLSKEGRRLYAGARIHLSLLLFLVLVVHLSTYAIEALMLQYTEVNLPLFYGPGYAEIRWGLPMLGIAAASMVLLFLAVAARLFRSRGWKGVMFFGVLALAAHQVRDMKAVMNSVNSFVVKPNEEEAQVPFIEQTIESTLSAYGLRDVERLQFQMAGEGNTPLQEEDFAQLENIPLWDNELLKDVFNQLQSIRPYYTFNGVDAARYTVNGDLAQVYLGAREITTANLPRGGQSWVNLRLKYTHGYGAVVTPAAQPAEVPMHWYLHDMPPESDVGLGTDNPGIYYGIGDSGYVVAPNASGEFHYPGADGVPVETDYTGIGGVRVDSLWRRLLFALYFKDRNLFFTRQTVEGSRIQFRRNVMERIERLTPFLELDQNPYLVIASDRMYWIVDAYTTSRWYPNSQPYRDDLNYIRNSVKITVDAYDGSVRYYLSDPTDPIALSMRRMYPNLIRDLEDMPDDIRAQVRYPRDLFHIQMRIFARYHQENPRTFYRDGDLMQLAEVSEGDTQIKMRPYYLTTDLITPGKREFLLVTPLLPVNSDNLRALAVVSSEPESYGEIKLYTFPTGSLVYGPPQINALIDQNTEIAQSMTLWNQQGSEVRRGKMLILPIHGRVLYIQPLYMEATGRLRIPQLKRIIVSTEGVVTMDTSIENAVRRLHARITGSVPEPGAE